jgi:hypothetical protein
MAVLQQLLVVIWGRIGGAQKGVLCSVKPIRLTHGFAPAMVSRDGEDRGSTKVGALQCEAMGLAHSFAPAIVSSNRGVG